MIVFFIVSSILYVWINEGTLFFDGIVYFLLSEGLLLLLASVLKSYKEYCSIRGYVMLRMVLVFLSVFVVYQQVIAKGVIKQDPSGSLHMKAVFLSILIMIVMGILGNLVSQSNYISIKKILGSMSVIASIVLIVLTGLFGENANASSNAKIALGGILILGPIIMMQPFIASLFLTDRNTNRYFLWNISLGKLLFLGTNVIIVVLNVIFCKDLGLCLVIGLSTAAMILPSFREAKTCYLLVFMGIVVIGIMAMVDTTFQVRIYQAFDTIDTYHGVNDDKFSGSLPEDVVDGISDEAGKIIRLQSNLFQQGWYGSSYADYGQMNNLESDYTIYGMVYCFGALFFFTFVAFTFGFIHYMYKYGCQSELVEDTTMAKMAMLLIVIPMLYIIYSNTGIIPLTGINFPYISTGKTMVISYSFLTGLLFGIQQQSVKFD